MTPIQTVSLEDYSEDYVYLEEYDEYLLVDSLEDFFCEEPGNCNDVPDYVLGTYTEELTISAETVVEHAISDHHDAAYDSIPEGHMARLQKYLDLWCKKANVHTVLSNDRIRVILSKEFKADVQERRKKT